MGWIAAIIVGGLAGWLAGKFMEAKTGLLLNIVLGIAGAALFNFVFGSILGLYTAQSWLAYLIAGVIGASALIWVSRKIHDRS